MAALRSITGDGVSLQPLVVRKPVKNVNVRLVGQCLQVSAPALLADEDLNPLIEAQARRLLRRRRAHGPNGGNDAAALLRRVGVVSPSRPSVQRVEFVAAQTRRWGSYSACTGVARLDAVLVLMPRWVVEAVVPHELVHSFQRNHALAFHAVLRQVCPVIDRAGASLAGVARLARRSFRLSPVEEALLAGVQPNLHSGDASKGKHAGWACDGGER